MTAHLAWQHLVLGVDADTPVDRWLEPWSAFCPGRLRVRKERWRFNDREKRKATGAWWSREDQGYVLPPTATDRLSLSP